MIISLFIATACAYTFFRSGSDESGEHWYYLLNTCLITADDMILMCNYKNETAMTCHKYDSLADCKRLASSTKSVDINAVYSNGESLDQYMYYAYYYHTDKCTELYAIVGLLSGCHRYDETRSFTQGIDGETTYYRIYSDANCTALETEELTPFETCTYDNQNHHYKLVQNGDDSLSPFALLVFFLAVNLLLL